MSDLKYNIDDTEFGKLLVRVFEFGAGLYNKIIERPMIHSGILVVLFLSISSFFSGWFGILENVFLCLGVTSAVFFLMSFVLEMMSDYSFQPVERKTDDLSDTDVDSSE